MGSKKSKLQTKKEVIIMKGIKLTEQEEDKFDDFKDLLEDMNENLQEFVISGDDLALGKAKTKRKKALLMANTFKRKELRKRAKFLVDANIKDYLYLLKKGKI